MALKALLWTLLVSYAVGVVAKVLVLGTSEVKRPMATAVDLVLNTAILVWIAVVLF